MKSLMEHTKFFCGLFLLCILTAVWGAVRLFGTGGAEPGTPFGIISALFLVCGAAVVMAVTLVWEMRAWELHRLYGCLALFFGISFLFTEPVFSVPDETSHFSNAYAMSDAYTGDPYNGGMETKRMSEWFLPYAKVYVDREGYGEFFASFDGSGQDHREVTWFDETRTNTSLLMYAVCAVGITLARWLGLSFGWMALLGQLCNLLFFVSTMTYAIYRMPYGKRLFCVIGLLPIVLQQAASYSYDVELLAAAVMVTALSFYWRFDKDRRFLIRDVIFFVLSAVILYLAKGHLYVLLLFLPVLLFGNKSWFVGRRKWYWVFGTAVFIGGVLLWLFAFGGAETVRAKLFFTPYIGRLEAPGHSILHYLLHLDETLALLFRTVLTHGRDYVFQMMGGAFGSFQVFIFTPIVYAIFAWLLISGIRRDAEEMDISVPCRIIGVVLMLFTDALALVAMMLYETGQNETIVEGFQGRYLLPTLPALLLFLLFWKKPVQKRIPEGAFPLVSAWLMYVSIIDYLCRI